MNTAAALSPNQLTNNGNFAQLVTKPSAKASLADIDKASKAFEATFIAQMMEPMFGDSIGDSAFGDKESSDIYKGMLAEQYGNIIQKAGGIGIAESVKRELLQLQEHQS